MIVNLSKAAELAGVSRQTIHKYIRTGRISSTREGNRRYIDTSELMRVFGALKMPEVKESVNQNEKSFTPVYTDPTELIAKLIDQVERLTKVVDNLTLRLEYKPDKNDKTPQELAKADPEWPNEVKGIADINKRQEILSKYSN